MTDVSLDPESILAEARDRTGLEDFGDPSFEGPFRRLVWSMDAEAGLHEVGRATQRERVVGLLVNRLRAEAAFAHHPEIEDESITEPFVIVGLARTGTTMLHRTLSTDPRLFTLYWWEGRHPAPFDPASVSTTLEGDPRVAAAEAEVAAVIEAAPELVAAHPMDALAPDEEIMLLEHSFYSTNTEAYAHVPSYSAWLEVQDWTPGYDYLKRMLKLIQWQKRRRGETATRWVLKTPAHLGQIDLLFETFPDIRVVQTHRDPVETIPSFASLCHMLRITGSDAVDPIQVGEQWCERMRADMQTCMDDRRSREDRFFDIRYSDLIADPMEQIEKIYDFVGLELTDEARARMQEWAALNARDKRPVHRYTLERFGYTEAGLARAFARYKERFGV